ncbi:MAG TPA: hypothetical protein VGL56_12845 [Fimbriimonadaceae bacterium]|jgi:cellobiose phosphorylase
MALTLDPRSDDKLCPNAFGFFRKDGREFVITNLATPMPWTNVMSNGKYGLVISQNGGGFSWGDNSQVSRITRWNQDLVEDRQGRFVYIQDLDSEHKVWSTTRQPTAVEAELDEVVQGLGYTTFNRRVDGIESSHTVFVPQDAPCEVWTVTLTNTGGVTRRLRIASYLEWQLGNANDWHHEFHRLFYFSGRERDFVYARKLPGLQHDIRELEPEQPLAFHGVQGLCVDDWLSDKSSFLGRPADLTLPGYLFGHVPGLENPRWNDPVASAIGSIELEPGETRTLVFTIGSVPTVEEAAELVRRFNPDTYAEELAAVQQNWVEFCERSKVETSDAAFDLMNNYWLKYQSLGARMIARCAYYQQGGAYGFRDQLQDSLGMLNLDSEITKRQLLTNAEAMYDDGVVRHWWHPNTDIFVESHHSDTCLWVAYGTLAYLEETNDLEALGIECNFLDRQTQKFGSKATLLEHCFRGIRRTLSKLSERGLPFIFAGDWNDGLSHAGIDGKGESVWLAMFLYDILQRWQPILLEIGQVKVAEEFKAAADSLQNAVEQFGWDGDWYLQGTRDDRVPLGSSTSNAGKIFLNPQTWAVISGIANPARAEKAIASAKDKLVRPYGALLLAPAFSQVDPWVGYITRYAPGLRENGGVYSHASTWMVQALAMQGWHDDARSLYKAMIPCNGRNAERYVAESYVMPGNVDGPDSPFEGRAGWTWYTGSASWMYRMALEWICGIRASREGLIVDPRSGSQPLNYRLKRQFRGDVFHFDVQGTGEVSHVECSTADFQCGKLQSTGTGAEHFVKVQLA